MNEDLERIRDALLQAAAVFERFTPGQVAHRFKSPGDPVTEADMAADAVLRDALPRDGEGWLSEETVDDPARLDCSRVWIVDPLDGTREFVRGVPDWSISVGLVIDGVAVAGGIASPPRNLVVLGSREEGLFVNGKPAMLPEKSALNGEAVLASRSEVRRGEWDRFRQASFRIEPTGSVALKMALVAAGRAAATWTLVPKNEWDVAGGTALVLAAGGEVWTPDGERPRFNREKTIFPGLVAAGPGLGSLVREQLEAEP